MIFIIKKYLGAIQILISIFLIGILLYAINFREVFEVLKHINLSYFFLGSFLIIPGIWISSFRWKVIACEYSMQISHSQSFILYWIGSFYTNFLPSSFGGDGYRFGYLWKIKKYKKSQILISLFLERGIGFLGLCVLLSGLFIYGLFHGFNFLTLLSFGAQSISYVLWIGIITVLLAGFIGVYYLFRSHLVVSRIYSLFHSVSSLKASVSIPSFLLAILFYILISIAFWAYFMSFGEHVDIFLLLVYSCMSALVSVIPLSFNGIGLKEGFLVIFFGIYTPHISLEVLLSIGILARISSVGVSSLGGLIPLFVRKWQIIQ